MKVNNRYELLLDFHLASCKQADSYDIPFLEGISRPFFFLDWKHGSSVHEVPTLPECAGTHCVTAVD